MIIVTSICRSHEAGFQTHDLESFYFRLIVIFYLAKTGNRIKKSLTQLSYYWLSKGAIFDKIADISNIRGALILKGIFFEIKYVCTYVQNFKFLA